MSDTDQIDRNIIHLRHGVASATSETLRIELVRYRYLIQVCSCLFFFSPNSFQLKGIKKERAYRC